ncbi:MAG TPA: MgtC/SapB family protein [Candidatus Hydrogenedentes bacterium]|nr:MgtC/SapB family protein [Candidatus Hydrogenedentota bacterium]
MEWMPFLQEATLKFLTALILSGLVGLEREHKGRSAGLRTHVLVCLGATLTMIVGEVLAAQHARSGSPVWLDAGRIAAGIITGIGFLGAGTIMTVGGTRRGLTTAATIWFVAALGIAIGASQYAIAAVATLFALIVIMLFKWLENLLPTSGYCVLSMVVPKTVTNTDQVEEVIRKQGFIVMSVRMKMLGEQDTVEMTFEISAGAGKRMTQMMQALHERFREAERIVIER